MDISKSSKSKKYKLWSGVCIFGATIGFAWIWLLTDGINDLNGQISSTASNLKETSDAFVRYQLLDLEATVFRVHRDVIVAGPQKENSEKAGSIAQRNMLDATRGSLVSLADAIDASYSNEIIMRVSQLAWNDWDKTNELRREIGLKVNQRVDLLKSELKNLQEIQKIRSKNRTAWYTFFMSVQLIGLLLSVQAEMSRDDFCGYKKSKHKP